MSHTVRKAGSGAAWFRKEQAKFRDIVAGYRNKHVRYYNGIPTSADFDAHDIKHMLRMRLWFERDVKNRPLTFCCNSLENGSGVFNGWRMDSGASRQSKRLARRQWAKANRKRSKMLIDEQLADMNHFDEPSEEDINLLLDFLCGGPLGDYEESWTAYDPDRYDDPWAIDHHQAA